MVPRETRLLIYEYRVGGMVEKLGALEERGEISQSLIVEEWRWIEKDPQRGHP
jgi:hypothetical protein